MKFYDAHNHLQDSRFGTSSAELITQSHSVGIARMVVNGTCERDWPQVSALAKAHPMVLPSFGYHPWYLHERTPDWLKNLAHFLDAWPFAVGEVGLDRGKPDLSYAGQEAAFLAQLQLAAERDLPVSIHCLQTWGRLHDLLREHPRPVRGFVLHSFGGPAEMIPAFTKLGAYFSFPGSSLPARKSRLRETFKFVPTERLLIETDAPDQLVPQENPLPALRNAPGQCLNHPANLVAAYTGLSVVLDIKLETLADIIEINFLRVFNR